MTLGSLQIGSSLVPSGVGIAVLRSGRCVLHKFFRQEVRFSLPALKIATRADPQSIGPGFAVIHRHRFSKPH